MGQGTEDAHWRNAPEIRALAVCDVAAWASRFRRIWLVAPHPDDEILALGGSLRQLSALGVDLCIVSVSDGEASHPGSHAWTPERLARTRRIELDRGLAALHIEAEVQRIGLPDGKVTAHRSDLLHVLAGQVMQQDLLLTTCSFDGHPDHEACGAVVSEAGERTGAPVYEYPVWMWHWASPGMTIVPWVRARRIPIDDETLACKREAIRSFASQIERDGPREAILPPHVLARFLRPFEVVFV